MNKLTINKYVRYGLILLAGLFLGWLFFHSVPEQKDEHNHADAASKKEVWTCSMHPHIKMDKPGKCPICAMDLILLNQDEAALTDSNAVHFTADAAALANVSTVIVSRSKPVKEVRLFGKVQADERLLQNQVAHISGRIEQLFVGFKGETVKKGQLIAIIYSPELITAQQELIESSKMKENQLALYEAAKEKLRQWMLTDKQIANIESSGQVKTKFEVYANTSGVVINKKVNVGDYVTQGAGLYDIANLSRVWVLFDVYESDLPFLKTGFKVDFTLQALPGKKFSSVIRFIDPVIDPENRVARIRTEVENGNAQLKPEMFVTGTVNATLDKFRDNIVVPKSSVLWTGKRSVVYVRQPGVEELNFKLREIETGPVLGNSYVVISGLEEGEEIVSEGTFSVDAAAQLEGKPSMMNQAGSEGAHTGHEGMNM